MGFAFQSRQYILTNIQLPAANPPLRPLFLCQVQVYSLLHLGIVVDMSSLPPRLPHGSDSTGTSEHGDALCGMGANETESSFQVVPAAMSLLPLQAQSRTESIRFNSKLAPSWSSLSKFCHRFGYLVALLVALGPSWKP